MRTLRFSAFFVFAMVQCFWAQTAQKSSTQQPAATQTQDEKPSQPQPPASTSQNPTNNKDQQPATQPPKGFKFKLLPSKPAPERKVPTGFLDRGFRASLQLATPDKIDMGAAQDKDHAPHTAQPSSPESRKYAFDHGIYEMSSGSGQFCGSIVSYNFSQPAPGEMPRLESVTTCTPSNKVVPRRAQGRGIPAHPPLLLQAVY